MNIGQICDSHQRARTAFAFLNVEIDGVNVAFGGRVGALEDPEPANVVRAKIISWVLSRLGGGTVVVITFGTARCGPNTVVTLFGPVTYVNDRSVPSDLSQLCVVA
eukprot:m.60905 g.60905  ORF g.60905 m.60905 type:complete len:106 (-) comp9531_c0_seq2:285-602(-)